eukprot:PhM_4_TR8790/c5_g1_i1/m.102304
MKNRNCLGLLQQGRRINLLLILILILLFLYIVVVAAKTIDDDDANHTGASSAVTTATTTNDNNTTCEITANFTDSEQVCNEIKRCRSGRVLLLPNNNNNNITFPNTCLISPTMSSRFKQRDEIQITCAGRRKNGNQDKDEYQNIYCASGYCFHFVVPIAGLRAITFSGGCRFIGGTAITVSVLSQTPDDTPHLTILDTILYKSRVVVHYSALNMTLRNLTVDSSLLDFSAQDSKPSPGGLTVSHEFRDIRFVGAECKLWLMLSEAIVTNVFMKNIYYDHVFVEDVALYVVSPSTMVVDGLVFDSMSGRGAFGLQNFQNSADIRNVHFFSSQFSSAVYIDSFGEHQSSKFIRVEDVLIENCTATSTAFSLRQKQVTVLSVYFQVMFVRNVTVRNTASSSQSEYPLFQLFGTGLVRGITVSDVELSACGAFVVKGAALALRDITITNIRMPLKLSPQIMMDVSGQTFVSNVFIRNAANVGTVFRLGMYGISRDVFVTNVSTSNLRYDSPDMFIASVAFNSSLSHVYGHSRIGKIQSAVSGRFLVNVNLTNIDSLAVMTLSQSDPFVCVGYQMKNITVVGGAPLISQLCTTNAHDRGVSLREGVIQNITLDGTSVVKVSNTASSSKVCWMELDGVHMKDIYMASGTEWCSVMPVQRVKFTLSNAQFDIDDQGGVAAVALVSDNCDPKIAQTVAVENATFIYSYKNTVTDHSKSYLLARGAFVLELESISSVHVFKNVSIYSPRAAHGAGFSISGGRVLGEDIKIFDAIAMEAGSHGGGAISIIDSYVTIVGLNIQRAESKTNGGCIHIESLTSVQSELDIIGGNLTHCKAAQSGGALQSEASYVSLTNVTIEHANARSAGGAFALGSSDVFLINVTVTDARAYFGGGCVSAHGTKDTFVSLENVRFDRCASTTSGGGVSATNIMFVAKNVSLYKCESNGHGGAFYFFQCDVSVLASQIVDSTAMRGGAVSLEASTLTWVDSLIASCTARTDGAGFFINEASAVWLQNVEFQHVSTTIGDGGGIQAIGMSQVHLSNVTARHMFANRGAFLSVVGANVTMESVFTRDTLAFSEAGAIACRGQHSNVLSRNLSISLSMCKWRGGAILLEDGCRASLDHTTILSSQAYGSGGGIYVASTAAEVVIRDLVAVDCKSFASGGALFSSLAGLRISGVVTQHCTATEFGGSVYAISGGEFSNMTLVASSARDGGAFAGRAFKVTQLSVTGAKAYNRGGGMYIFHGGSRFAVENVIISTSNASDGGGIYIEENNIMFDPLFLSHVEIHHTLAFGLGGGIAMTSWCCNTEVTCRNVSVTHSHAVTAGGGVFLDSCPNTFIQASSNMADGYGADYAHPPNLRVRTPHIIPGRAFSNTICFEHIDANGNVIVPSRWKTVLKVSVPFGVVMYSSESQLVSKEIELQPRELCANVSFVTPFIGGALGLQVMSPSFLDAFHVLPVMVSVVVDGCPSMYMYQSLRGCVPCMYGMYRLSGDPQTECRGCPDGVTCTSAYGTHVIAGNKTGDDQDSTNNNGDVYKFVTSKSGVWWAAVWDATDGVGRIEVKPCPAGMCLESNKCAPGRLWSSDVCSECAPPLVAWGTQCIDPPDVGSSVWAVFVYVAVSTAFLAVLHVTASASATWTSVRTLMYLFEVWFMMLRSYASETVVSDSERAVLVWLIGVTGSLSQGTAYSSPVGGIPLALQPYLPLVHLVFVSFVVFPIVVRVCRLVLGLPVAAWRQTAVSLLLIASQLLPRAALELASCTGGHSLYYPFLTCTEDSAHYIAAVATYAGLFAVCIVAVGVLMYTVARVSWVRSMPWPVVFAPFHATPDTHRWWSVYLLCRRIIYVVVAMWPHSGGARVGIRLVGTAACVAASVQHIVAPYVRPEDNRHELVAQLGVAAVSAVLHSKTLSSSGLPIVVTCGIFAALPAIDAARVLAKQYRRSQKLQRQKRKATTASASSSSTAGPAMSHFSFGGGRVNYATSTDGTFDGSSGGGGGGGVSSSRFGFMQRARALSSSWTYLSRAVGGNGSSSSSSGSYSNSNATMATATARRPDGARHEELLEPLVMVDALMMMEHSNNNNNNNHTDGSNAQNNGTYRPPMVIN